MKMCFSFNKEGHECCGSDSYFPCDGRWSLSTCIYKAREYYGKQINKPYGFKVCFGTILNHKPLTQMIRL